MNSSLTNLLDQFERFPSSLTIWTTVASADIGYSFETTAVDGVKVVSYFQPDFSFHVKGAEVMQLVTSIQQSKKAQSKMENWDANEIKTRFEKIKNIIETNKFKLAGLEAHFQGTTRRFQTQWSIEPLVQVIDGLLEKLDAYDGISPKGLIGAITPKANSFFEIGWRILFALFHKDGIVIKPATETALSALLWQEILKDCEFPEGLISFVYGPGTRIGQFLMDHPGVRNISFSGGYDTLKNYPISLEKKYQFFFNGKNSVCILSEFDFKARMKDILRLFIEHNGRGVFSPARLLVIDSVEKEFKLALAEYLLTIPTLKTIDDEFGYLPLRENEKKKLSELKSRFESEEAKIIYGNENFLFYSDLANCSELYQENLELPIFNLTGVKYQHEMTKWSNNTVYGHSVVIFGAEEKTKKLGIKSEVGRVILNPMPLKNEPVSPVKLSGFGEVSFSIPNSFYSYVKS